MDFKTSAYFWGIAGCLLRNHMEFLITPGNVSGLDEAINKVYQKFINGFVVGSKGCLSFCKPACLTGNCGPHPETPAFCHALAAGTKPMEQRHSLSLHTDTVEQYLILLHLLIQVQT